MQPVPPPTIYYDGHCGLCSSTVQLLLRLDDRATLRYAPLQSRYAAARLGSYGLEAGTSQSVVLEAGGRVYTKSDAALKTLDLLGWPYRLLSYMKVIPRGLRNRIYDWVAARRLQFFGAHTTCWLPREAWRERFIGEE